MDRGWKSALEDGARFNESVNTEMYLRLGELTSAVLNQDRGSHFGSVMGLLNHIIVADLHWLNRYRVLSPDSVVLNDGRLGSYELAWKPLRQEFEALRADRHLVDGLIRDWFSEFPESRYGEMFVYTDSGGGEYRVNAGRAFDFLFMHQVHHRGQISQILDGLGIPHSFADNKAFLSFS